MERNNVGKCHALFAQEKPAHTLPTVKSKDQAISVANNWKITIVWSSRTVVGPYKVRNAKIIHESSLIDDRECPVHNTPFVPQKYYLTGDSCRLIFAQFGLFAFSFSLDIFFSYFFSITLFFRRCESPDLRLPLWQWVWEIGWTWNNNNDKTKKKDNCGCCGCSQEQRSRLASRSPLTMWKW